MATPKTISEYIRNEPAAIRTELTRIRAIISKAAPKAKEKIAWGMPTFVQNGNLCHFAAFKSHLSLFPGSEAVVVFKKDLTKWKTSKGTIQFPYGRQAPASLITRIVKFCIRRNSEKAKARLERRRSSS